MMARVRQVGLMVFGLVIASNAGAGATVVPGGMSPNDLAWLAEATGTTVSGSLDALLSKPINGTLTTAKGAKIPLPAGWSAAIPRATVAQAAGKLLARATPITLAGLTLYQLLHSNIGMNSDGTVQGYVAGPFSCHNISSISYPRTTGSVSSICASYVSFTSACETAYLGYSVATTVSSISGDTCHFSTHTPHWDSTWNAVIPVDGTETVEPTESDLGTAIQNSPVPTADIVEGAIKDSKILDIDFKSLDLLKLAQPTTVSAQPVVGPEEVIDVATSGTKTTTTKVQTTATPKVTGTTVADTALEWETADKTTKTTTDSATGVTTTETTTTSYGTSTTQQKPDYGTFTGADPGDGFTDGRTKVKTALCGGNCDQSLNCAAGTCSVSERMTTLRAKYSLAPTATGTCPAITMDLSSVGYGSHSSTEHCDLMESVRAQVGVIMSIMIALGVFTIVLGA